MLGHFAFQLLGFNCGVERTIHCCRAATPRTICVLVAIAAFSNWDFA
jgi:hypothetical protein